MFIFRYPKCYFGYPKYLFWISKINIPDIRNYAKKAFYLRHPKKLFWISKTTISRQHNSRSSVINTLRRSLSDITGQPYLFRMSKIIIPYIKNYAKKGVLFEISKKVIFVIKNNNFGYPKLLFWISK